MPRLSMGRLRATWLVDLIDSGVALPTVIAAAGVDSLHALSRLMPTGRLSKIDSHLNGDRVR